MHQDDPVMTHQPPSARDYFLACYTVSLVRGQTILGTLICHNTILNYLKEAYALFDRADLPFASECGFVRTILKAVKDYEEVPKRRRMITDNMMSWLISKAAEEGPDSATTAIVDWILIGRYTGFRASEWSQTTQGAFDRVEDWPGKPARAMTRSDFTFMDGHERPLHGSDLSERMIKYLMVRWRIQKNRQNGQKVTFAGDPNNPAYCATSAALRVYRRSVRLGMKDH